MSDEDRNAYIERVTGYLIPKEDENSRAHTTLSGLYSGNSKRIHDLIARAYRRGIRRGASAAFSARQPITIRDLAEELTADIPPELLADQPHSNRATIAAIEEIEVAALRGEPCPSKSARPTP